MSTRLTSLPAYEYAEEVGPVLVHELEVFNRTPAEIALETAHNVAFHTGLGGHRLAITPKYVGKVGQATYGNVETAGGVPSVTVMHSEHTIPGYAQKVYQKGNIAVVASGAEIAELEKWTKEFFAELPSGEGLSSLPSKYYGGENRVYCPYGDAIVIAYPGTHGAPGNKAELTVLSYLLGGEAGTKWNAGTSALSQAVADLTGVKAVSRHHAYSDAGLLAITITGPQDQLKQAGTNVVKAIDSIASSKPEDVKRAIAQAKFDVLAAAEDRTKGLELIGQSVIASGKAPQVEDVVKALEGVTVESVKKVSRTAPVLLHRKTRLLTVYRLLRRSSVAVPPCPLLAISTSFPSPARSASSAKCAETDFGAGDVQRVGVGWRYRGWVKRRRHEKDIEEETGVDVCV